MDWFIDWVTIHQVHEETEIVGKNVVVWLDPATGERLSEGVGYLSHEGSFSTSVSIRAHGGRVEWSGNPSRWGRCDNVFGYKTLRECLDNVINPHLVEYGLPPFSVSPGYRFQARRLKREGESTAMATVGACLTRVDLCRNLSAGSAAGLAAYLRAASSAVYRGKAPNVYPGSLAWGEARNSRLKIYDKGAELYDHTKHRSPIPGQGSLSEFRDKLETWKDYHDYRMQLATWAKDIGLMRQELTLGRQALRSLGLRALDEWSDNRAATVAAERFDAMKVGCTTGLQESTQAFLDAGMTKRRAVALSGVVSRWYMGEPADFGVHRATFYRYRSQILEVLGLDISSKPSIAMLTTQVRMVELSPAQPPAWYRHAA